MKNVIYVNPKEIKKLCPVAGSPNTRKDRIKKFNLRQKGIFLTGQWDLTKKTLVGSNTEADYNLYLANTKTVYDWQQLINKIKREGYIQNKNKRYVEVAIGRTGEILLVDGRHRLWIAQQLNLKSIPVNVLFVHPKYNFGNLSIIQNKIIPQFLYDIISDKWDKKIKVYHYWGTINHRYNLVKKHLPLLKGKNVLEIGANSGMLMWSLMNYANSLVEIEKQKKYYQQCLITKNCLSKSKFQANTVAVINDDLKNYYEHLTDSNFNALYVSFVLYHLNNEEIKIIKDILLKCDVVIVPNRNKERGKQKNSYFLNRPEKIKKLLKETGFKVTIDYPDKDYSVIVGIKK